MREILLSLSWHITWFSYSKYILPTSYLCFTYNIVANVRTGEARCNSSPWHNLFLDAICYLLFPWSLRNLCKEYFWASYKTKYTFSAKYGIYNTFSLDIYLLHLHKGNWTSNCMFNECVWLPFCSCFSLSQFRNAC